MNEPLLRDLVPAVIGVLVRRGADVASAEDAVEDALVEADGPRAGLAELAREGTLWTAAAGGDPRR